MNTIKIWGFEIQARWLSSVEIAYLETLPKNLPSVEWVSEELDRIWFQQGLVNSLPLNNELIGAYYSHPVWLMNGIFSACDPASLSHRTLIARYLRSSGVKRVADYGGGFGQLALCTAAEIKSAEIFIVEPYPSQVGIERLRAEPRIQIVPTLAADNYDAVVAQDLLEHVEDPINLAHQIANSVRIDGYVIFANCFFPTIESHLPSTFHLRHTFPFVMKALGLRQVGSITGAEHIQVYQRVGKLYFKKARKAEAISRLIGPVLNYLGERKSSIKNILSFNR